MINVGIIGMGRSGWELHATTLKKFPAYRLVAVSDQSQVRLFEAARTFGARAFSDGFALINDPDIQLIVIATPSSMHTDLAIAAMEAGKHVLVEKPMAANLSDAEKMITTAQKTGRILTVFHNRRWDRDYLMIKNIVHGNLLGQILNLESRVMTFGPEWSTYGVPEFDSGWRTKATFGGGFLADWGPHLIEQCLDLTGELPETVACQLRSQLWATEVEDYFYIRLTFPSGLLVTLEGSNNARDPLPRWFVVGKEGTLISEGVWGKWTNMHIKRDIAGMKMEIIPQDTGASSGGGSFDVGDELSAIFYNDLAEAIQNGSTPAITAQRARDVMAVLETARQSNASGQIVKFTK